MITITTTWIIITWSAVDVGVRHDVISVDDGLVLRTHDGLSSHLSTDCRAGPVITAICQRSDTATDLADTSVLNWPHAHTHVTAMLIDVSKINTLS